MLCPACSQPLQTKDVILTDGQKAQVHECFNCGGHFLASLIANLLPVRSAHDLD
ncbi:zf-TFIIB domain-containing protein, partial [Candidatus Collierbacteria bacterium]|nr:zf-TFIIB domain-containing protein [Candidatus Collierbacteria bacterium]